MNYKKLLSIFFSIALVIGISDSDSLLYYCYDRYNIANAANPVYEGQCGENITWNLNRSSGLLTLTGTGAMYDFEPLKSPWYQMSSIKKIIINEGITTIGDYSFFRNDGIQSVILPSSMKCIGKDAFHECKNLNYISFSYGLEIIKYGAFYHCDSLTEIIIPNSVTNIENAVFMECSGLKDITLSLSLNTISSQAFSNCTNLSSISIPNSITYISNYSFSGCKKIESLILPESVENIGMLAFDSCDSLSSITINNPSCKIGNNSIPTQTIIYSAENSNAHQYADNNGIIFKPISDTMQHTTTATTLSTTTKKSTITTTTTSTTIKKSTTTITTTSTTAKKSSTSSTTKDSTTATATTLSTTTTTKESTTTTTFESSDSKNIKQNKAQAHEVVYDTTISENETIAKKWGSSRLTYNNGYYHGPDRIQEILDSKGNLYAATISKNKVIIVPYDVNGKNMIFEKEDFECGSVTFDDNDNIYVMWAHDISEDDIEVKLKEKYVNVFIERYDETGKKIAQYDIPINTLDSQYPYRSGNAHIGWKNDVLLVYYHTRWIGNHQGSVAAAFDTTTGKMIFSRNWQGSHAFGSCMIPTEYGFAAIQMGDATARGINFNSYYIGDPQNFHSDYLGMNGHTLLFHSSGQYGSNEHRLDGNTTYIHMGGLAKGENTYAVAGKAERVYTSDLHKNLTISKDVYDVFVQLHDNSLNQNTLELAGEDRLDEHTGEVVDRHIIWLTECNKNEKAGNVKVVTLEDGSYCVLWERYLNYKFEKIEGYVFDSIRYIILDAYGNIIREETSIKDAWLSETSIQPIVYGNTLRWAVRKDNNSLIWFTVDLNEFTDQDLGDINGDNIIDGRDATDVLTNYAKTSTGQDTKYSEKQLKSADANNDGVVDGRDATLILTFYAYISTGNSISFEGYILAQPTSSTISAPIIAGYYDSITGYYDSEGYWHFYPKYGA